MYYRYMNVSKYQMRDKDREREAALTWLHRQMAWEQVLNRLRHQAGVSGVAAPSLVAGVERPAA
jgi:hypothetical protein